MGRFDTRSVGQVRETMTWRLTLVACYVVFAIVIGFAYGLNGLAVVGFFGLWAAAFTVFLFAWGGVAQRGGRWYFGRQDSGRKLGD